ncbi:MAG: adaptor protein MecA [Lachnospiraceae bacterium]|nr:adaptor protein MecA [Lachnospiraceae bacterium]
MTINRYDEDTIECLLTPEDLKNRKLSLKDLTYNSPVLKSLTSDLLRFLRKKYDFSIPADLPVSIEAVPHADGSLSVIFSKNSYEDDIDPRYSMFSEPDESESDDESQSGPITVQDAIHRMLDTIMNSDKGLSHYLIQKDSTDKESASTRGIVVFDNFNDVLHLVSLLSESLPMNVGIFRSEKKAYLMIFHFYKMDDEELESLLSIICEYGMIRQMASGTEAYITEHCEMIMPVVPFIIAKTLMVNYK